MKNLISLSLLIIYSTSGCVLLLRIPKKLGKEKWKTEDYKLKLKHQADFAGPSYYKVKLKKRGLFHSKHKFSVNHYKIQDCVYKTDQMESINIDFCKRTIDSMPCKRLKIK